MRLVQGRGYWEARHKIESLTRYAFLGDSYVFGPGVGAMETLPARTERHLNETVPGGLFEAVNLGVNGFNLWNAWLSFKRMPQIYDGAILSLCSNDAQLFELTLRVNYGGRTTPYWDSRHTFRGAIEGCFDDIAAYGHANRLPIAVCYHTLWPRQPDSDWVQKLSGIVAALCAPRGIAFIDLAAHLNARNIAFSELVLDAADYHPSKLAHDAAARYLAQNLRTLGWLDTASRIAGTPDRILAIAQRMIADDAYPRDVALRWADAALGAKRTAARRAADNGGDFFRAADKASNEIAAAHKDWQAAAKCAAVLAQASAVKEGISLSLYAADEDALRLEELGYVLARPDRRDIVGALPAPPQRGPSAPVLPTNEAAKQLRSIADDMGRFAAASGLPASDAAAIGDFANRTKQTAEEILGLLDSPVFKTANVPEEGPGALLGEIVGRAAYHLDTVRRKLVWTLSAPPHIDDETTVEVTLATSAVEGRNPSHLAVWSGSTAPRRPPMKNQRQFLHTGGVTLIRLKLPLFYAGQLMVLIQIPPAISDRATADLVSLEVYNSEGPRRTLGRDDFVRDAQGRLVSPNVYLV